METVTVILIMFAALAAIQYAYQTIFQPHFTVLLILFAFYLRKRINNDRERQRQYPA